VPRAPERGGGGGGARPARRGAPTPPLNPATDPAIIDLLRNDWLPLVRQRVAATIFELEVANADFLYVASDYHIVIKPIVENGLPTEGRVPAGRNCSSHWFEPSPGFRNGGIVAHAFFKFGTRFLEVNRRGKIDEIGYFLPYAGSTSATYWITDEILYAVDYHRGIDILRFDPDG
jgi:hypothetical protein